MCRCIVVSALFWCVRGLVTCETVVVSSVVTIGSHHTVYFNNFLCSWSLCSNHLPRHTRTHTQNANANCIAAV